MSTGYKAAVYNKSTFFPNTVKNSSVGEEILLKRHFKCPWILKWRPIKWLCSIHFVPSEQVRAGGGGEICDGSREEEGRAHWQVGVVPDRPISRLH